MKRSIVLIIMVGMLPVVSGCRQTTSTDDEYLRAWLRLQYSPLELASERAYSDGPIPEEGMGNCSPGKFIRREVYGEYAVLSKPGAALLLNCAGQPLWAGEYALPVRLDRKVAGLLLLRAVFEESWYESVMYRVRWLPVNSPPEKWAVIGDDVIPVCYDGTTDRIIDIDGDGTDEVILAQADVGLTYGSTTDVHWSVVLLKPERPAPPAFGSLFEGPAPDDSKDTAHRAPANEIELREMLEIPIDFGPYFLGVKAGKNHGSIILQEGCGDTEKDLGEIVKEAHEFKWVPGKGRSD